MAMRAPGFTATMRALRHGIFVVALGGLLTACASDESRSANESAGFESGGMAGVGPDASGGAAGSGAGGEAVGAGGATTGAGGVITGGGGVTIAAGGVISGNGTGGVVGVTGGMANVGGAGGAGGLGAGGSVSAGGSGGSAGTVNAVCSNIVAGTSTLTVNGTSRTFSVQLPANTSRMALLFLWHGFMQVPTDFANTIVYDVPAGKWVPFDPNGFPMPLMIVTPVDTKLLPPAGLDWDIVSGATDFPYFEAMLQCIKQQFQIDETRIYSFGFSAGAVFTDLLSAKYPHLFAATISESGAWFNDQAEWSDVTIPLIQWQWPSFNVADGGNVLLTHGGTNDFATVISLESANHKALPFLHDNGRTVTECAHTFGHTLDPDLTQRMYYDWMWAHQLGGSPISGLPGGFPTQANPVGATSCWFHPYP
jgi:predicted esterase